MCTVSEHTHSLVMIDLITGVDDSSSALIRPYPDLLVLRGVKVTQ